MLRLDDLVAQARTVGDEDLELLLLLLLLLAEHLLVGVETGLALGLTSLRGHAHPLQLALQRAAALRGRFLLLRHALRLLVEPGRVVALPGDALAAVELQDPLAHVVEEVAVVGDGDDRALILLQVLLQPVDALGVEVVGGLVEQEHVGLGQEQAAQGHTAALTTGEVGHGAVARGTMEGAHRTLQARVHVPGVGRVDNVLELSLAGHELVHLVGVVVVLLLAKLHVDLVILAQRVIDAAHTLADVLQHGLRLVEGRVLGQIAHGVARAPHHFALRRLDKAGDDLHQRRFTRAVETDDANLRAIEKGEIDVVENPLLVLGDDLRDSHHGENDFLVVGCCHVLLSCCIDRWCKVTKLFPPKEGRAEKTLWPYHRIAPGAGQGGGIAKGRLASTGTRETGRETPLSPSKSGSNVLLGAISRSRGGWPACDPRPSARSG